MEKFIFDFIVVVLGILFALFLGKLNDKRKHKNRIHSIMNIISTNLNHDLSVVKRMIKDIDHKFLLLDKLQKKSLMSEDELKECMLLATDYIHFDITKRGYNLLKDARVDFEFKNSVLISKIIGEYDAFLSLFKMHDRLALNISEKNTRSLSDLDCSLDFHKNIISEQVKDHMQTTEYIKMLQNFLYGNRLGYKKLLKDYAMCISEILPAIDKSDFK